MYPTPSQKKTDYFVLYIIARVTPEHCSFPSPDKIFTIKQVGGEVTDFIIVLRNNDAVRTFGGNVHFSIGAGLSAAVGIVGRAAEADIRAGDGGYAACYTYSCSKGTSLSCNMLECSEV